MIPPPGATGGSWNNDQPKPTTAKILSFLSGKLTNAFIGISNAITVNVVLKVEPRIKFNSYARKILHHVFVGDVSIGCLQMIRQTVVCAVEIVAFVFNAEAKIPFSGNQKAMVIAEIVIERIAVTELRLLEIAVERICRLVRENVV